MISKLQLPDSVNIADGDILIQNVNGVACLYCNGEMIGTLDYSSIGYHLGVTKDGIYLDAVFTTLENVFSFLVRRKGNFLDVK